MNPIKKIIKTITGDGQEIYSGHEENAEHLARAWGKTHPENTYEVVEVEDSNPSIWERLFR